MKGPHSKGKYKPKHPEKYIGDPENIVYRSSWEKKSFLWCDMSPSVLRWGSEEIIVPYVSPVDGKWHRYFPDLWVELKTKHGLRTIIFEIKPEAQTKPPKPPKRKTRKHLDEVSRWGVNEAKWNAAIKYCEDRGWQFKLLTEENVRF